MHPTHAIHKPYFTLTKYHRNQLYQAREEFASKFPLHSPTIALPLLSRAMIPRAILLRIITYTNTARLLQVAAISSTPYNDRCGTVSGTLTALDEDGNRFDGPRFEGCVGDRTLVGTSSSKPEVNDYLSEKAANRK